MPKKSLTASYLKFPGKRDKYHSRRGGEQDADEAAELESEDQSL